ncbi:MAG: hypothetical protein WD627_06045 [Actinomycetota bacterium]
MGMLVLVLACFLLTFVSVSCGSIKTTRSGAQMAVTGTTTVEVGRSPIPENLFKENLDPRTRDRIEELFPGFAKVLEDAETGVRSRAAVLPAGRSTHGGRVEALASIALLAALVGLMCLVLPGKTGLSGALVAAVMGAVTLVALKMKIEADIVPPEAAALVTVRWGFGYWGALALLALVAVWAGYALFRKDQQPSPSSPGSAAGP